MFEALKKLLRNFQFGLEANPRYSFLRKMVELSIGKIILPSVAIAWLVSMILRKRENSEPVSPEDKPAFGSGKMFDKFAAYYDIGNRFMSLGQDQSWRRALLKEIGVNSGDSLLDLATGSGDVAIAARTKFQAQSVVGLDPSVEMLKVAKSKAESSSLNGVTFVEGDAQSMPQFETGSFTKITMSFGIRNVPDRMKALREMRRVIASEDTSRLAIMEFSAPSQESIIGKIAQLFVRYFVPFIGGLITNATEEYRYLEESIFKFPSPTEFSAMISEAGFEMVTVKSFAAGVVNVYVARPRS
jgi:demethylmenaquinone methyltransferase/2-methoxy-6-polyprenyl-1,4-benzoquinol methylase